MTIGEALGVLKQHSEWRSDIDGKFNHPATDPKLLTEALKIAIAVMQTLHDA